MNAKNEFKQAVIKDAVKSGVSHPVAVREVEASLRVYTEAETGSSEEYGASVGDWGYGSRGGEISQKWPISTTDGSIGSTALIQVVE